ncbi:MAG: hypothetical protein M3Z26_08170 [Bacteroidota bacterium]|nr:hypothetical protein [Bacteroidota bacterium]
MALTTNKGQYKETVSVRVSEDLKKGISYLHYEVEENKDRITVEYDNENQNTSYANLLREIINRFKGIVPAGQILHSLPYQTK